MEYNTTLEYVYDLETNQIIKDDEGKTPLISVQSKIRDDTNFFREETVVLAPFQQYWDVVSSF